MTAPNFQSTVYPYATPPVLSDLLTHITWRYDQSPNMVSLLNQKTAWYNQNHDAFWNNWLSSVFDLKNAGTFGLGVWAFILNVPQSLLALNEGFRYWAFDQYRENFTDSTFTTQNPSAGNFPPVTSTGQIVGSTEQIQTLRLKYYTCISPCTITEINAMLTDVFAVSGLAYVLDNQNMTMTYVFTFEVSPAFQEAMLQYGLLPKPAGVAITIQTPSS